MSDKLITKASEFDIARARALGNQYDPDIQGRFPWVTRDYGGEGKALTVSKTRLGLFFEALLRHHGDVSQLFAMGTGPRNYVQASVRLTVSGKEAVERETGITLSPPPVVRVNQA